MKIIDLLNKIANGVTYTKKARIRYFDRRNDYEDECILNEVAIGYRLYNQNIELNDEVEILEEEKKTLTLNDIRESYGLPRIEEKKIPEKLEICKITDETISGLRKSINVLNEDIVSKTNEIIDYLDYLKSKGDE